MRDLNEISRLIALKLEGPGCFQSLYWFCLNRYSFHRLPVTKFLPTLLFL